MSFIWILAGIQVLQGTPQLSYSGKTVWDDQSKTLTFAESGAFPETKEGFYWSIPDDVKKVVIGKGVTVSGGFRVGYRDSENPLMIEGEDRETSIIYGTSARQWTTDQKIPENDKWKYGAVSVLADAVVYVSGLTSENPRGYHISGYANQSVIHVDRCSLLDTRGGDNNNSDGFIGSAGSSIKNSLINTLDDGIKIYHDIKIDNVTIRQHRNGAAIQFGWGGEKEEVKASIRNLTIEGVNPKRRYNMAPFTWEAGKEGTRVVEIDGLKVRFQGEVYHESTMKWKKAGLFELKPENCSLNFRAVNADLDGLKLGLRRTKGEVSIQQQ